MEGAGVAFRDCMLNFLTRGFLKSVVRRYSHILGRTFGLGVKVGTIADGVEKEFEMEGMAGFWLPLTTIYEFLKPR